MIVKIAEFWRLSFPHTVLILHTIVYWSLANYKVSSSLIFLQCKSHMFSSLTSNHRKAVSCLSLSDANWVGTADMLSEVSAPHGDTHHYHHHLPLPPSLSVCLCLSHFVSSSMLPSVDGAAVPLLTHNTGSGEKQYGPASQGSIAVVASCQSGISDKHLKKETQREKREKERRGQ